MPSTAFRKRNDGCRYRPGDVLAGRYRLLRCLGSGGMGTVFLAEHVYLTRPTALKVLRPEARGPDPTAAGRFRREALLAARISHPAVAQVYDFDRTADGEFLLAMEYVEGETVGQRLGRTGPLVLPHVARVLTMVADGLDQAHRLGILHRDLKPDNVMLGRDGATKLLDFGIALERSSPVAEGPGWGTPAYMSPEQLLGESLSPATDVYALGVTAYEMITGQLPHAGARWGLAARRLMDQPPLLGEVLERALEIDPAARWPTAGAFAQAVADAVTSPAPGSHRTRADRRGGTTTEVPS